MCLLGLIVYNTKSISQHLSISHYLHSVLQSRKSQGLCFQESGNSNSKLTWTNWKIYMTNQISQFKEI